MLLAEGGTLTVYAETSRWGSDWIHVRWLDDAGQFHRRRRRRRMFGA